MGFFDKFFARHKHDAPGKEPLAALTSAVLTATHRATEELRVPGGIELKEGDWLRYETLFSELLYFYMHITLRLAHGGGFTEPEIKRLQANLFPPIIEGMIEGPMGHWPEEKKAKIKAEHYENVTSAEFEYGSCKSVYPIDDPLAVGNSVYATLARKIEKRLGQPHNPELSSVIIPQVSEQLRALQFPKLIAATKLKK